MTSRIKTWKSDPPARDSYLFKQWSIPLPFSVSIDLPVEEAPLTLQIFLPFLKEKSVSNADSEVPRVVLNAFSMREGIYT